MSDAISLELLTIPKWRWGIRGLCRSGSIKCMNQSGQSCKNDARNEFPRSYERSHGDYLKATNIIIMSLHAK